MLRRAINLRRFVCFVAELDPMEKGLDIKSARAWFRIAMIVFAQHCIVQFTYMYWNPNEIRRDDLSFEPSVWHHYTKNSVV